MAGRKSEFSKGQISVFVELWNSKKSLREIALITGFTKGQVSGIVTRNPSLFKERIQKVNQNGFSRKTKEILNPKPVTIEDPPRMVPIPDGALNIPWVDLERNQCQWGLSNDFFEPASNKFLCCGLKVVKDRCCEHHLRYRKKGWE